MSDNASTSTAPSVSAASTLIGFPVAPAPGLGAAMSKSKTTKSKTTVILSGVGPSTVFAINDDGIAFRASPDNLRVSNFNPRSADGPRAYSFNTFQVKAAIECLKSTWCSGNDPTQWSYAPHEASRWIKVVLARNEGENDEAFATREQKLVSLYHTTLKEKGNEPRSRATWFVALGDEYKFEVLAGQHRLGVAKLVREQHPNVSIADHLSMQIYRRAVLQDCDGLNDIVIVSNRSEHIRGFSLVDILHVSLIKTDLAASDIKPGTAPATALAKARSEKFDLLSDQNPAVSVNMVTTIRTLLAKPEWTKAFTSVLRSSAPSAWIALRGVADTPRETWRNVHTFGQGYAGALIFEAINERMMLLALPTSGVDSFILQTIKGLPASTDSTESLSRERFMWDAVIAEIGRMRVMVSSEGEGLNRQWRYDLSDLLYEIQFRIIVCPSTKKNEEFTFTPEELAPYWFAVFSGSTVHALSQTYGKNLGYFVGYEREKEGYTKKLPDPTKGKDKATAHTPLSDLSVLLDGNFRTPNLEYETSRAEKMKDPESWAVIPTHAIMRGVFEDHATTLLEDILEPLGHYAVSPGTVWNPKASGGAPRRLLTIPALVNFLDARLGNERAFYRYALPVPATVRRAFKGAGKHAHEEAAKVGANAKPKLPYAASVNQYYRNYLEQWIQPKPAQVRCRKAFHDPPLPSGLEKDAMPTSDAESEGNKGEGKVVGRKDKVKDIDEEELAEGDTEGDNAEEDDAEHAAKRKGGGDASTSTIADANRPADQVAEEIANHTLSAPRRINFDDQAWLTLAGVKRIGFLLAVSANDWPLQLIAADIEDALLAIRGALLMRKHPLPNFDSKISLSEVANLYARSQKEPESGSWPDILAWIRKQAPDADCDSLQLPHRESEQEVVDNDESPLAKGPQSAPTAWSADLDPVANFPGGGRDVSARMLNATPNASTSAAPVTSTSRSATPKASTSALVASTSRAPSRFKETSRPDRSNSSDSLSTLSPKGDDKGECDEDDDNTTRSVASERKRGRDAGDQAADRAISEDSDAETTPPPKKKRVPPKKAHLDALAAAKSVHAAVAVNPKESDSDSDMEVQPRQTGRRGSEPGTKGKQPAKRQSSGKEVSVSDPQERARVRDATATARAAFFKKMKGGK